MDVKSPKKQALTGSCHCGLTQFIIFLTLPHPFDSSNPPRAASDQKVYRCNCNTCLKLNIFHVHPANQRDDFILLSPPDPDHELTLYQCNSMRRKWYFCPKCGVRCFGFTGEGESVMLDLPEVANTKAGRREVWRAKWDGEEATRPYLSVNGTSIDYHPDFDLRLLVEEKRVRYLDDRSEPENMKIADRWDRPHYGGCY